MTASTQAAPLALGQTRSILLLKTAEYVGLVAFTVIVPRTMGPDLYGQFSGIMATVGLLSMVCGLGAQAVFGRFVPEYEDRGEAHATRTLFTQYFLLRGALAVALGAGLIVLLPRALPEAAGAPVWWGAGALVCWVLSLSCYQLFYGLNVLPRWLAHDALAKLALLAAVFALGGGTALTGAAAALFVSEAVFLVVGLAWSRPYFTLQWTGGGTFFRFHLRFGLLFFGANVLLLAIWRGGEVTVLALSDSRSDIGYFNLASAAAMALSALIGQVAAMLAPSIAKLHVSGDARRTVSWLAFSLKYLTVGALGIVLGVHAFGDLLVRVALGTDFLPVAANLKLLVLSLFPVALVRTGITQAAVQKTPAAALTVGIAGLATFVLGALFMVPRWGALGASGAVSLAVGVAGAVSYFTFSLGPVLAKGRYWRVVLSGAVAAIPFFVPGPPVEFLGAAAVGLFGGALFVTGAVDGREIRRVVEVLRR